MTSTSSSSDESSKSIPQNFQVSECSSENENFGECDLDQRVVENGGNKATCFLCLSKQRRFHCRNCVKNGNIVHSGRNKKVHKAQSLLEKQQKYLHIQGSLNNFRRSHESLIKEKKDSENTQFLINRQRDKIRFLQQLIDKKHARLEVLNSRRDELRKANIEKCKNLFRYPIKVKELGDFVLDRIEKIRNLREHLHESLHLLKLNKQKGIKQLVQYIFPIIEIVLKDEKAKQVATTQLTPLQQEEFETIAALADAKNTSYIRGKWVFHGSGISEMQIQIVAPSLPANGDYSAYVDWLSDNKDDVPKAAASEIEPSRVSAFRIIGALTYTTQLINLMSYYLNIRLPYKMAYGDFCKKLNEEQFLNRVSRLNSNILYLAYTQGVKLSTLNENHTLENVLAILDLERSDLGRHGNNDVTNSPLIKSVDSLLLGIETATESESEGTHIPVLPPSEGYLDYINRKGWSSVVMQAVVDHKYLFRDVSIKFPGSTHDATVFKESGLFQNSDKLIPKYSTNILGVQTPLMLVGDPAYPLLQWLIKPFVGSFTDEEESFNCYLSSGRIVVENAFGRLKARWRCLLKRLDLDSSFVPSVVLACVILHNFVEKNKESFLEAWLDGVQNEGAFQQPPSSFSFEVISENSVDPKYVRNNLKKYMAETYPLRKSNIK